MATQLTPHAEQTTAAKIPHLHTGDRLTRVEFERRYLAMPHVNKAELVEGVVYLPSPVSADEHGEPHFDLITWLGNYRVQTPGVLGGDNTTVRLDIDNELQPDAHLRIRPESGGSARIVDGSIEGAPEFLAEVSATSASYDLHDKFNAYRRNGVKEYFVWRVEDAAIDWFVLRDGRFDRLSPDADGIYRSRVFPGLWLEPAALVARNVSRVFEVLQAGLASSEHAAFVRALEGVQ